LNFTKVFLILILLIAHSKSTFAGFDPADDCEIGDPPPTETLNYADTVKAVMIFGADTAATLDIEDKILMKQWMYDAWDSTLDQSLPIFYEITTFGKFKLSGDTYPQGDTAYLTNVSYGVWDNHLKHYAYHDSIFAKADLEIDFGAYDNNSIDGSNTLDGKVDFVILNILTAYGQGGRTFYDSYTTNDTNSLGNTVIIDRFNTIYLYTWNDDYYIDWQGVVVL